MSAPSPSVSPSPPSPPPEKPLTPTPPITAALIADQFPWTITTEWSSFGALAILAHGVALIALAYFGGQVLFAAGFAFLTLGLLFGAYYFYACQALEGRVAYLITEVNTRGQTIDAQAAAILEKESTIESLTQENLDFQKNYNTLIDQNAALQEKLTLAENDDALKQALNRLDAREQALQPQEAKLAKKERSLKAKEQEVQAAIQRLEALKAAFSEALNQPAQSSLDSSAILSAESEGDDFTSADELGPSSVAAKPAGRVHSAQTTPQRQRHKRASHRASQGPTVDP